MRRDSIGAFNLSWRSKRLGDVRQNRARDYDVFVAAHYRSFVAFAVTLTGSVSSAEDLVQDALFRTWRAWPRIRQADPHGYTRTVLVRTFASSKRRRWVAELPVAAMPETAALGGQERSGDADRLLRALLSLPPQMRAVVVLRFREDLSEKTVADLLRCPVGSVKSQGSRGLARLREALTLTETGVD